MAELQQVDPSMFDGIYAGLLRLLDPTRERSEWQRIFTYGWKRPQPHVGYVLIEDGDPVGFLGLIFSEVVVAGECQPFCNVTSLIAKETHRGESSSLVLPLRGLKDYTVTNLSCNEIAYRLFTALGFQTLETHLRIVTPARVPSLGAKSSHVQMGSEVRILETVLEGPDLQTFHDHLPYAEHLAVWDSEGYSYLVYSVGRRWRLRTARIHYISDKERFVRYLSRIQASLFRRHGTLLAECDARLLKGLDIPSSFERPLRLPRLYRSSKLSSDQINNIYSELVLLNMA